MTVNTQELRELVEKATPGEWRIASISQEDGSVGIACGQIAIAYFTNAASFFDVIQGRHPEAQFSNANLLVYARNELSALLDEIDRLREALRWNSACLLSYTDGSDGDSFRMTETGETKRISEVLDMADAALAPTQGDGA